MKLEVGKRYRNRKGEVVMITNHFKDQQLPYLGSKDYAYTNEGFCPGVESEEDLNEEVKDETMTEIKLKPEILKTKDLMLNRWYCTRGTEGYFYPVINHKGMLNGYSSHIAYNERCFIYKFERLSNEKFQWQEVENPSDIYLKIHKASGLKVGDRVRVLGNRQGGFLGWALTQILSIDYLPGEIKKITHDKSEEGFVLDGKDHRYYPCYLLQKVEKKEEKLRLNDQCDAIITKEKITIFPQEFKPEVFEELYKKIQEVKGE